MIDQNSALAIINKKAISSRNSQKLIQLKNQRESLIDQSEIMIPYGVSNNLESGYKDHKQDGSQNYEQRCKKYKIHE